VTNDFTYDHKVYAFRKDVTINPANEKVTFFRNMDSIRSFFKSVSTDKYAREDLLSAAKWAGISFPLTNGKPSQALEQKTIEQLCLTIWGGHLFLVEITFVEAVTFKPCCIKSLKQIDDILALKTPFKIITYLGTMATIFYHPGNGPVGQVSTYVALYGLDVREIRSTTLEALAHAMIAIPVIVRESVFKIAEMEATIRHHNDRELKLFWKGMMDVLS
jgi:hypothetical protein